MTKNQRRRKHAQRKQHTKARASSALMFFLNNKHKFVDIPGRWQDSVPQDIISGAVVNPDTVFPMPWMSSHELIQRMSAGQIKPVEYLDTEGNLHRSVAIDVEAMYPRTGEEFAELFNMAGGAVQRICIDSIPNDPKENAQHEC